jgi:uncharacterized protein (TIGR02001 family)
MKHTTKLKTLVLSMAIAGSSTMALMPLSAQAGVSANIGVVSQYIFRGIQQNGNSPAAQGGLDYAHDSGFYVGIWGSTVGAKGKENSDIEYDIYGGWSGEFSGVSMGAGVTLYNYGKDVTKDANAWDTSYQELNFSLGYGPFSVGYDIGKHAKMKPTASGGTSDEDYSVLTLNVEYAGAYATWGRGDGFIPRASYGDKAVEHTWIEVGYGTEIAAGTDVSIAYIHSSKEASGYTSSSGNAKDNGQLVVGITKTFDLM